AASGAPFSASRAASSASMLTPLLTFTSAISCLLDDVEGFMDAFARVNSLAAYPCVRGGTSRHKSQERPRRLSFGYMVIRSAGPIGGSATEAYDSPLQR